MKAKVVADSEAVGMTAATVLLAPACRVSAVQAAILIVSRSLTFARCMSTFFGGL